MLRVRFLQKTGYSAFQRRRIQTRLFYRGIWGLFWQTAGKNISLCFFISSFLRSFFYSCHWKRRFRATVIHGLHWLIPRGLSKLSNRFSQVKTSAEWCFRQKILSHTENLLPECSWWSFFSKFSACRITGWIIFSFSRFCPSRLSAYLFFQVILPVSFLHSFLPDSVFRVAIWFLPISMIL